MKCNECNVYAIHEGFCEEHMNVDPLPIVPDAIESLKELLGESTKSFGSGESLWWANLTGEVKEKALRIIPNLYVSPVYAYPQNIPGGQRYDVNWASESYLTRDIQF